MCRDRDAVLLPAVLLLAILLGATGAPIVRAADAVATNGTVSGVGMAVVKVAPTTMRMYMQIVARGATLEDAVAALKERQEEARNKLQELGAMEKSIAFTPPSRSNVESQGREQFERMIEMRMSKVRRDLPKGLELPPSFAVSSILRADWPLQAQTPEKLMITVEQLQQKIKSADIGASEEPQNLSPEEQELAEELGGMMDPYVEENAVQPGVPWFVFAATVSEAQRDKALAEAFAKAKVQAQRLAQAAGASLGPLAGLSSGGDRDDPYQAYRAAWSYYPRPSGLAGMLAEAAAASEEPNPNEITSQQLGKIHRTVRVHADFKLE